MNDDFWFHLLAGTIALIYTILCGAAFLRHRTKYNLAILLAAMAIFVGIVLSYLHTRELGTFLKSLGFSIALERALIVLILVTGLVSLSALLYYPRIRQFLTKVKSKRRLWRDHPRSQQ